MGKNDLDIISVRELIAAALNEIEPFRDASHRWAAKWAIVKTIKKVRTLNRDPDFLVTPKHLNDGLDAILEYSRSLRSVLNQDGIDRAVLAGWVFETMANQISSSEETPKQYDEWQKSMSSSLEKLERFATSAIENLSLKGKKRMATMRGFANLHPAPKILLVGCGLAIYVQTPESRTPTSSNTKLSNFLAFLWECATGEPDVQDWTRPIRTFQFRKNDIRDGQKFPNVYAGMFSYELSREMERKELGRRNAIL